jgi:hypothetical protein
MSTSQSSTAWDVYGTRSAQSGTFRDIYPSPRAGIKSTTFKVDAPREPTAAIETINGSAGKAEFPHPNRQMSTNNNQCRTT